MSSACCIKAFRTPGSDVVPALVIDQLRRDFQTCTLNTLFFTQELLKLLQLFEAHQIPVLPYKGPALAQALYSNLSLRSFCDLDLLIHPQDLIRVKPLLVAEGYEYACCRRCSGSG